MISSSAEKEEKPNLDSLTKDGHEVFSTLTKAFSNAVDMTKGFQGELERA